MIAPHIDESLVSCGRPGCLTPLGRLTFPKRWRLIGQGWHYDRSVKPARWRRLEATRMGRRKGRVREHYAPYLPGGRGYDIGRRAVVECPRCKAVQRIDG